MTLSAATGPGRRTGRPPAGTREAFLVLDPSNTAPRAARALARAALAAWRLACLTDTAELIASELVTNAIAASRADAPSGAQPRPVTFWLAARDGELLIGVKDSGPAPPPRFQQETAELAENGRGLAIVAALSRRWGWYPAPGEGKHVWAAVTAGDVAVPASAPPGKPLAGPEQARD